MNSQVLEKTKIDQQSYKLNILNNTNSLTLEMTIPDLDVVGFELYSYVKLKGFQSVPQLFFSQTSAAAPAGKVSILSDLRFIHRNGALYSSNDEVSGAYLPSTFGGLWNPKEALQNITNRLVRVDHTHRAVRWLYGSGEDMVISVTYDHSGLINIYATPYMVEQLYRATIQYVYFLIPIVWIYVKLTDHLIASGSFGSIKKIEKLP